MGEFVFAALVAAVTAVVGAIGYWLRGIMDRRQLPQTEAQVERSRWEARQDVQPLVEAQVALARQQLLDRYRTLTELRNALRRVDHEFEKLWLEPQRRDLLDGARTRCRDARELSRSTSGLEGDEQRAVIAAMLEVTDTLLHLADLAEQYVPEGAQDYWRPGQVPPHPREAWEVARPLMFGEVEGVRDDYAQARHRLDLLLDGLAGLEPPWHVEESDRSPTGYLRWRQGPEGWRLAQWPIDEADSDGSA